MIKPLRNFFSSAGKKSLPTLPEGQRVYAIGDIHGRLDLFDALIEAIEQDDILEGKAETTVILLGDLVDRGPDSKGVIERARKWQKSRNVRIVAGNHEEMFLSSIEKEEALRHFIRVGGKETILSYGISSKKYNAASMPELLEIVQDIVPTSHRSFLENLEDMIEMGDYVFVHAGVNPDRDLDDQKVSDLRWIRQRFIEHRGKFERIVVHGHTIFKDIDERSNRIGIDTGAYKFGKLTALVLEGSTRRYIQSVEQEEGRIIIEHKDQAS